MPPGRNQKIPRPPNAFMLYRSQMQKSVSSTPTGETRNQSDVSKVIGEMWRNASPEVRTEFRERAVEKKKGHDISHPDYKYNARREGLDKEKKKPVKAKATKSKGSSASLVPLSSQVQTSVSSYGYPDRRKIAVMSQGVAHFPPYRYGGSVGFDEIGAYAVEEPLAHSWEKYEEGEGDIPSLTGK